MHINHSGSPSFIVRIDLCTFPLLTLLVFSCRAQQPVRLPKVLVQGAALPAPNPLDSADSTRMTAQDWEQQQSVTLSDALRRLPGAYVTQSGGAGIGQEARVSFRGTGHANTAVIVNGMTIHDAGSFDGAFNLSRWTLDDVAEIHVIRGPMSSLYGPSGIGGVVVIETKKGRGPHTTFAKAEGGSFHTASQMVGIQGQKNLVDYHVAGSRLQSAGPSPTPARFLSQIQEKANNPLRQETMAACLGAGPESAHISLVSRYLTRRLGWRDTPVSPYPWRQNLSESFNRLQGHFENDTGRWSHEVGLGYYQNDLTSTHPAESKVMRNGSQAQIDWRQIYGMTDHLHLQMATDYSQEKLYWYKMPDLNHNFTTSHGGAGGALSFRVHENLMITGSSRIDKYQGIAPTATYRVGGQYDIEKMTVKGGMGSAFKAPTLQQKFYKDSFFTGNPGLKPERSLGWDAGIERPFFQNRLTVGVTLFQNRMRDLIASASDGKSLINIDKSRTEGMEGLIRFHPVVDWTFEVSHTYTQAWDEKTAKPLIGNPLNKTSFCMIGQMTSEWQISGNLLYISPRHTFDAVTFVRVKTPSYTIIGAETSYQLNEQWQIYGRGENILNRRYESPKSLQQPGFGLYAGVRARCSG